MVDRGEMGKKDTSRPPKATVETHLICKEGEITWVDIEATMPAVLGPIVIILLPREIDYHQCPPPFKPESDFARTIIWDVYKRDGGLPVFRKRELMDYLGRRVLEREIGVGKEPLVTLTTLSQRLSSAGPAERGKDYWITEQGDEFFNTIEDPLGNPWLVPNPNLLRLFAPLVRLKLSF